MLKLKEIYAIPGTAVPLTDYILTGKWVPELPDLEHTLQYAVLAQMETEGAISIRQLFYQDCDGERSAGMYTLWFNNAPVAIIHSSGRGGSEDFKRWITDATGMFNLVQYLRTKMEGDVPNSDVYDPESLVYPEEVFWLYGSYRGDAFGYPREKPATGWLLLFDNVIPHDDKSLILVTAAAKYEPMPEYIRRHESVLKLVAKVSDDELARNPRVELCSKEDGLTQIYWYRAAPRPEAGDVLAV